MYEALGFIHVIQYHLKIIVIWVVLGHTFCPSTQEAEVIRCLSQGQPGRHCDFFSGLAGLHKETYLEKQTNKQRNSFKMSLLHLHNREKPHNFIKLEA